MGEPGGELPPPLPLRISVSPLRLARSISLLQCRTPVSVPAEHREGLSLHAVIHRGDVSDLSLAVSDGHDAVNVRDNQGYTALMVACALTDVEAGEAMVKVLVKCGGSDLGVVDNEGFTALHWAAACASETTVRCLVEHGADVRAQSRGGDTPLHRASRLGRADNIVALLEWGADPFAQNCRFLTPLDVAGVLAGSRDLDKCACARRGLLCTVSRGRTMILSHSDCLGHGTENHQESPLRFSCIMEYLSTPDIIDPTNLSFVSDFPAATEEQLVRVHARDYVALIQRLADDVSVRDAAIPFTPAVQRGLRLSHVKSWDKCDTSFSSGSYAAALRAAGAVCRAVDAVVNGECRNAFCVVRPPGHHAGLRGLPDIPDDDDSCGFCLVNNVAIGAFHALAVHSATVRRVAIVDIDAHHGNGTEEVVRRAAQSNPSGNGLLFVSLHLCDQVRKKLPAKGQKRRSPDDLGPPVASRVRRRARLAEHTGVEATEDEVDTAGGDVAADAVVDAGRATAASGTAAGAAGRPRPPPILTDEALDGSDEDIPDALRPDSTTESVETPPTSRDSVAPSGGGNGGSCPSRRLHFSTVKGAASHVASTAWLGLEPEEPSVRVASSELEYRFYPGTGSRSHLDDGCINVPIAPLWRLSRGKHPSSGRVYFLSQLETCVLPALRAFRPDLILVSAGFDGGAGDIGNVKWDGRTYREGLDLTEEDFYVLTRRIVGIANRCCPGRVVSVLEGGYGRHVKSESGERTLDRDRLVANCAAHVMALAALPLSLPDTL